MSEDLKKESILEAARNEKSRGMEYENRTGISGGLIALLAALAVGTVLFLIELFSRGTLNLALITLLMTAAGTDLLYEGIRMRSVWRIIAGGIQALLALFFALGHIWQVVS